MTAEEFLKELKKLTPKELKRPILFSYKMYGSERREQLNVFGVKVEPDCVEIR